MGGKPLRAVVLAYQEIGAACLEQLVGDGVEVAAVFTHEDDPQERIWFRSVERLAGELGLSARTPAEINTPAEVESIRALRPDVLFSFYYRRLVGRQILEIPPAGCFNLHGSLLPRYRGRAPVNWAILNGETETGVTLHHMVETADAGDIVAQRQVPIYFEDTALTVSRRLADAGRELLRETLPLLREGRAPRQPQDEGLATTFGRRSPADGRIDWRESATRIHNLVRAVTRPWPGAFTGIAGRKVTIWESYPLPAGRPRGRPGEVIDVDPQAGRGYVQTGDGVLEVQRLEPDGEADQSGSRFPIGTVFEEGT